ncbi:MAG: rod shape-determining protein MreD [Coriobacteriales bacterium]|nr:rod shape-determining protein MreD [Coriobacteriales bacterium]
MNKVVPAVLAIAAATLLQALLGPAIAIGGAIPNFLLIVAITLALVQGPVSGAVAGFAAGLIFDLLNTGPVGAMALVLAVTCWLAGLLFQHMFAEGWLLPLTVLGAASFAAGVAYSVILLLLGEGESFWLSMLTITLPGAVYNTALALLVYPWLARFLRQERPVQTFRRLA